MDSRRGPAVVVRWRGASAASDREPRPDPGGGARLRRRAQRDHRRDGRREDDPLERGRAAARRARRGGADRSRGRRGLRRGGVRPSGRRGARRAGRAAARGRGDADPRAADLRRRPDAGLRLGPERRARGRRRGGRGAARHERPVRAAPARAAELPARGARRLRRDDRHCARRPPRLARARGRAPCPRRAHTRRGGRRGAGSRSCARSSTDTEGLEPGRGGRASGRSGSGSATSPSWRRPPQRRSRRSRATSERAPPTSSPRPSGRSRRSRASRPSSPPRARRSAPPSSRCATSRSTSPGSSTRSRPSRAGWRRSRARSTVSRALRRRYGALDLRRAARAGRRRARRARGASPRATTRRAPRPRRSRPSRPRSTGCTPSSARRAGRPRRGSPRRSPRSSRASGSARASSAPRFGTPTRGRPAPTRSPSPCGRTPGLPFGPVAETASGGELSRIALAIAAVAGGETMVFDEIDAGIGGQTAHAVGETLRRLATRAQVITITHLPQIASLADRHFRVEKVPGDPTHTRIEALEADERREELERMLGGADFLAALARMKARHRASSSPRGPRPGRSSPSRTTSPTGGRESSASSPTGAASPSGARWQVDVVADPLHFWIVPLPAGRPAERAHRQPDARDHRGRSAGALVVPALPPRREGHATAHPRPRTVEVDAPDARGRPHRGRRRPSRPARSRSPNWPGPPRTGSTTWSRRPRRYDVLTAPTIPRVVREPGQLLVGWSSVSCLAGRRRIGRQGGWA